MIIGVLKILGAIFLGDLIALFILKPLIEHYFG